MIETTRAIRCPRCGASTPLPTDLRVPSFRCAFCAHELATADYAGDAAVSADALMGHIAKAIAEPTTASESARTAPKFDGNSAEVRQSSCVSCAAPIVVPMDITQNTITCAACGQVQAIERHVSQKERFEHDMARQVAGNRALDAFFARGVSCTNCGGHLVFPDDGSIQTKCPHCGTVLVASQWVDASAVARRRLKHAVYGMRDDLIAKQKQRDRSVLIVALVVAGVVVAIALVLAASRGGG